MEGLIRAHVRGMHKGITTVSGVTWHAYRRWAAVRGEVVAPGPLHWSGWLVHAPVLAERRGTASATLAAVRGGKSGTVAEPVGTSLGAHAVTRSLPAGLCDWYRSTPAAAAEIAALTHTGEAITAAARGAEFVAHLCRSETLDRAVPQLPKSTMDLAEALRLARTEPNDAGVLRSLAPDSTAVSALIGGVYVARAAQRPEQVRDALVFAAAAGDGGHVATVAGALLVATHGPAGLPVDWVSRLELVWIGDTLARDYVQQVEEGPSGSEYAPGQDPTWWERYPGG